MTSYVLPMPNYVKKIGNTKKSFVYGIYIGNKRLFVCLTKVALAFYYNAWASPYVHYATNVLKSLEAYSIIAVVYESLPGKRKALSKILTQVCRYRPCLTIYLAIELYFLPRGRKRAGCVPGSIAIIGRSSQNIFSTFRLLGAEVTRSHS